MRLTANVNRDTKVAWAHGQRSREEVRAEPHDPKPFPVNPPELSVSGTAIPRAGQADRPGPRATEP
jgi:hypothetical protein